VQNNEESALVLMLKDRDTGFFEEELGQYKIVTGENLIEGLYAEQAEDGLTVCLRIGAGSLWAEIGDDLYSAIYDRYDADLLPDFVTELIELDDCYNPMWEARFLFSDSPAEMEGMIRRVLADHRKALSLLLSDEPM